MSARSAIADLETKKRTTAKWKYLAPRPSSWKRQLYVEGSRLPASVVWTSMLVNNETVAQAAHNWDLTVEMVEEIVKYCEENEALLDAEDHEERRYALAMGMQLEPPPGP